MKDSDFERSWAGLSLARPRVMGILNVTPDSFSNPGQHAATDMAIAAGLAMAEAGADIVDVGGESTRPGATPVSPELEQARIAPVVRALSAAGLTVSADTRNAATMRVALQAGARIINDVSGLTHDPAAASVAAESDAAVVLMHMRGTPESMGQLARYHDVVSEVMQELQARIAAATEAGIHPKRIVLDPGIGFAKRSAHSEALLRALPQLRSTGFPLLVGVSRKAFIGSLSGEARPDRRLGGSLAAALFAVHHGAAIVRVHDVVETVQALRVWHHLFISGNVETPKG